MADDDRKPGDPGKVGGAHSLSSSVSSEEALRQDLELRANDRKINAAYYEAKGDRVGRVRKFGKRR